MLNKIVFAFSVCLLSFAVNAQTNEITAILHEIEQNNKELQALTSLLESNQLKLKAGNNLPDPQARAYYLPWGEHNTGDYSEFQVAQSFEFPTVYGARSNLIDKKQRQIELAFASKRQEVLLAAKKAILELVFLNKKMAVEQRREKQAKMVVDQVQELFEREQIGILEVNKARIAWMQEQFKVQQIETNRRNIMLHLQNLNGGVEVTLNEPYYAVNLELTQMDSIWQNRQLADPTIKIMKQQEEITRQQIKLSKNESLPNLVAGFNYQGVSGANYSGVYGGLSIPLWSNRHKVKAAESKYQYQKSYSSVQLLTAYVDFQKQYNDYQILLSKFQEYQRTLTVLNSDALLFEAYELGEISFIIYYMELQFYRTAFDSMLDMEKQLNQLKAQIMSFEL